MCVLQKLTQLLLILQYVITLKKEVCGIKLLRANKSLCHKFYLIDYSFFNKRDLLANRLQTYHKISDGYCKHFVKYLLKKT